MKKILSIILVFTLLDLHAEPFVKELRLTPEGKIIDIVLDFNIYQLILSDEGVLKSIVNKINRSTDMEIEDNEMYQEGAYCRFDKRKNLEYIEEKLVKFDLDSTKRIDEIGDMRIYYQTYYGNKEKIRKIANLNLEYDLLIDRVEKAGKMKIRYDMNTKKIWRIYSMDSVSCGFDIIIINPYQRK